MTLQVRKDGIWKPIGGGDVIAAPSGAPLLRPAASTVPSLDSLFDQDTATTGDDPIIMDTMGRADNTSTWATPEIPWADGNHAGTNAVWTVAARSGRASSSDTWPSWVQVDSSLVDVDVAIQVYNRPSALCWRGCFARKGAAPNSYYGVEINHSGTVRLVKYVAGTLTVLATSPITTWPNDTWLRLRCDGDQISAYASLYEPFADTPFFTATDTDLPSGSFVGSYQTVANLSAYTRTFIAKGI